MATSLLMQGGSGGESPVPTELPPLKRGTEGDLEADLTEENLALLDGYSQLDDDKNPYSKEERTAIQKNVRIVNERSKSIGEKRIEILEREAKQK